MTMTSYQIPLISGQQRFGALLKIIDEKGNSGWGDVAPLPKWSTETLEQSLSQLQQKKAEILNTDWTLQNYEQNFLRLSLFPSVIFGLESALLSILSPLTPFSVPTSALFMGSPQEILEQARARQSEGFLSAKLKVGNLSFDDAAYVIHQLKDKFNLRIDVNRAWETADSLRFFSQFANDAFDYVEEPFKNPHDLIQFQHPLAVDESFPQDLSLTQLEALPQLKALIYKPTIQGGLLGCRALHEWATKRNVSLILSSSFESYIGLSNVASIAHRLSIPFPVGIGTYHHMLINNPVTV